MSQSRMIDLIFDDWRRVGKNKYLSEAIQDQLFSGIAPGKNSCIRVILYE
ncbi:MAG: hypothetical protein F6K22_28010 [Okeania sp. SIO2F4]|nr:hypothetical protein [Okeania sp. SIO2F4]NES06322.1 hypothetical protein [Okeania sp. SIO2F4]